MWCPSACLTRFEFLAHPASVAITPHCAVRPVVHLSVHLFTLQLKPTIIHSKSLFPLVLSCYSALFIIFVLGFFNSLSSLICNEKKNFFLETPAIVLIVQLYMLVLGISAHISVFFAVFSAASLYGRTVSGTDAVSRWWCALVTVAVHWLTGDAPAAERLYARLDSLPAALEKSRDPLVRSVYMAYRARRAEGGGEGWVRQCDRAGQLLAASLAGRDDGGGGGSDITTVRVPAGTRTHAHNCF